MTPWTDEIIGFLYTVFFLLNDFFCVDVLALLHQGTKWEISFVYKVAYVQGKFSKLDGYLL